MTLRPRATTAVMIAVAALAPLWSSFALSALTYDEIYVGEVLESQAYHPWAFVVVILLATARAAALLRHDVDHEPR